MQTAKWLLPIIGSVVLVCLLYHLLDLHQIANLRQQANWTFLVIASILTLPFVLLKTLKWHQLLKTDQPQTPYTLALRSFLIGIGASLFTPARVGELARIACFPRQRSEVFTLVIADKFIDMSTLLGVFVLSLALLSPWLGVVGLFGLGCLWVLIYTGVSLTKGAKWMSQEIVACRATAFIAPTAPTPHRSQRRVRLCLLRIDVPSILSLAF